MRDGDRVRDPSNPTIWWHYRGLDWWAGACTGIDYAGHAVRAWIEGNHLVVQHGDNPEAVRRFTLDTLNHVGGHWEDGDMTQCWFDEIDAYELDEPGSR